MQRSVTMVTKKSEIKDKDKSKPQSERRALIEHQTQIVYQAME